MNKHKSKTTVEFISDTKLELTIGNDIAVINAPNPASARELAALAEAGLICDAGDKITARRNNTPLKPSDRIVTEERHGHMLFIVKRKSGRELLMSYDVQNIARN